MTDNKILVEEEIPKEEPIIEEPKIEKPKPKRTLSEKDIEYIEKQIREARTILEIGLKKRTADRIGEAINILTEVIKKLK